jgi:hypothetical protein
MKKSYANMLNGLAGKRGQHEKNRCRIRKTATRVDIPMPTKPNIVT